MSKTSDCPHDQKEEVETFLSEEGTPFFYPPSGLTSETDLLMPTDLIGHLYFQGRQVDSEQLGIGPFEQLQFSVLPEAINRAFFDPLAFSTVPQQDGEGLHSKTARLVEFWQGIFSSASKASSRLEDLSCVRKRLKIA